MCAFLLIFRRFLFFEERMARPFVEKSFLTFVKFQFILKLNKRHEQITDSHVATAERRKAR